MDTGKIATDARVRVALERSLLDRLAQDARVVLMGVQRALPEPEAVRRQLLGRAVRLTEAMAPTATCAANQIRDAFGLQAIVVASFHPDPLSVARAKNDGPRLFKAYLEYVHQLSSGARTLAMRTLDLVRTSSELGAAAVTETSLPGFAPLAGQLAEALLARGVEATVHVGASRFKVDVAIEGAIDGRPYRVAVLCDEGDGDDGAYRRAQRAASLRRRDWRVVHVDGIEWLADRKAVLARIERAMA